MRRFWGYQGVIRIRKLKKNRQRNGQTKKGQKDKQRSTKHTHKTKDRVTRTLLKTGCELRCSGMVGSSTYSVNLVRNPVHVAYYMDPLHLDVTCYMDPVHLDVTCYMGPVHLDVTWIMNHTYVHASLILDIYRVMYIYM